MSAQDNIDSQNVKSDNYNFFESSRFKIFHSVTERNYQINPFYIKVTGSITSGYFLTQLIFLARAYKYSEFFKTDEYFIEKLHMTEWEVRNHKKILIDLGFVSVIKSGFPAKSHYKVNLQKIVEMAEKDIKPPESGSHEETSSLQKPTSKQSAKDGNRTEVSSVKSRGNLVTALSNNDLLNNNNNTYGYTKQEADTNVPVVVSSDLKSMLNAIGLEDEKFWVKTYGEVKIREKFSFMPEKSKITASPAAWLRDALQRDHQPPKNVATVKNGGSYDIDTDVLRKQRFQDADEEYRRRMNEYKEGETDNIKKFIDVLCGKSCELSGATS